jgi:hypothetical protein
MSEIALRVDGRRNLEPSASSLNASGVPKLPRLSSKGELASDEAGARRLELEVLGGGFTGSLARFDFLNFHWPCVNFESVHIGHYYGFGFLGWKREVASSALAMMRGTQKLHQRSYLDMKKWGSEQRKRRFTHLRHPYFRFITGLPGMGILRLVRPR